MARAWEYRMVHESIVAQGMPQIQLQLSNFDSGAAAIPMRDFLATAINKHTFNRHRQFIDGVLNTFGSRLSSSYLWLYGIAFH